MTPRTINRSCRCSHPIRRLNLQFIAFAAFAASLLLPVESANAATWLRSEGLAPSIALPEPVVKTLGSAAVTLRPVVCRYEGNRLVAAESPVGKATAVGQQADAGRWSCAATCTGIEAWPDALDITVRFRQVVGRSEGAGVAVALDFAEWSTDHYLFVPGGAYAGNRFRCLPIGYPPYFDDRADQRLDLPVTITDVPRLNVETGPSKLELLTSDASTPAIGVYDPARHVGLLLYTEGRTRLGASGLTLEENRERTRATLVVSAPGVRQRRYTQMHVTPSRDRAARWRPGDEVSLHLHLHVFAATDLQAFFDRFFATRKVLSGANAFRNLTPYSAALDMEMALQNRERWFEPGGYYKNGNGDVPNGHVQLGWVGGLMSTYPLLFAANDPGSDRA